MASKGAAAASVIFLSGTDLRAPGSKLKYELREGRMGGQRGREGEGKDRRRHQKWGTDGDFTCAKGPSPDLLKYT